MNKFDELLSLKDAAFLIGVTPDYLRAEISRGNLVEGKHCMKYGKQWVVNKSVFLNKYANKPIEFSVVQEDSIFWVYYGYEKIVGCSNMEHVNNWIDTNGGAYIESGAIFI